MNDQANQTPVPLAPAPESGDNRRKTDWRALLIIFFVVAIGAAIGAFIIAPLCWPDRVGFAARCLGAAIGIFVCIIVFGTFFMVAVLFVCVVKKLMAFICRRQ